MTAVATAALAVAAPASAPQTEMSWHIDPATQTHRNIETKLAFPRRVGGFRLQNAEPAQLNGTATFTYASRHGEVTILFVPRSVVGCAAGQDCTSPAIASQTGQMKTLHGRHESQQTFGLQGVGRRNARGATFTFAASPRFRNKPAYGETGAFEIGNFIFGYRAAFSDKAGLDDLATLLRVFGVRKV